MDNRNKKDAAQEKREKEKSAKAMDERMAQEEEEQQSSYEQVQEAFLRFFVATFKDYRKFLNIPDFHLRREAAAS